MSKNSKSRNNSNSSSNGESSKKHYSPSEKMAILRKHLIEQIAVSEICDQYKIPPTTFYKWQRQLFEQGEIIFSQSSSDKPKPSQLEQKVAALEEKLARKHEVLSELMEEHIKLKKNLGES